MAESSESSSTPHAPPPATASGKLGLTSGGNLPVLGISSRNTGGKDENFRKTSYFHYTKDKAMLEMKAGHKVVDKATTAAELLQTAQIYPPNYTTNKTLDPYSRYIYGDPKPQLVDHNLPDWVKYDRMVLRYFMWFEEEMPESKFEARVIRKCVLYYYLSDKTLHIGEPHEVNSGMPQGVFLSRRRINHPDGHPFELSDFMVGKSFWMLGREYHIVDVDDATRQYYEEELHLPQPGRPEGYPDRPYADELTRSGQPPVKLPVESICGPRPKDTLRQFLDYDRKVLRFTAVWDDRDQLNGDKRCYIVHYYLSDDNVEVVEVKVRNDGRAPFPKLLRKMRLFKPEVIGRDREYYTDKDLRVGEKITIYNRPMLLIDCDPFTKEFYARTYGVEQGQVDIGEPLPAWPEAPVPYYTGFGSEADSMASHLNLIPKPPPKDYKRMVQCSKKVLRFLAELADPKVEDKDRRFIILFYLGTDLIQIYEPPCRNSGFVCGKYLERGYYTNPDPPEGGPPRPFKASDLEAGRVVQFMFKPEYSRSSEKFRIIKPDHYTEKYWDGVVSDRPPNETEAVQLKFVNKLSHTVFDIKEVFTYNDPEFKRCITVKAFYDMVARLGVSPSYLNEEDVQRVVAWFAEDSLIFYDDFFDTIAGALPPEDSNHLDGRLTTICSILYDNDIPLRKILRAEDVASGKGLIPLEKFQSYVDMYGLFDNLTEEDVKELLSRYQTPEGSLVKYHFFLDDVFHCLDRPTRVTVPEYKPYEGERKRVIKRLPGSRITGFLY